MKIILKANNNSIIKLNTTTPLQRNINFLNSFGINNIIISTSDNEVIDYCKKNINNITFDFVDEKEDIQIENEDVFFLNGGIVLDILLFEKMFLKINNSSFFDREEDNITIFKYINHNNTVSFNQLLNEAKTFTLEEYKDKYYVSQNDKNFVEKANNNINMMNNRTVYMCFSTEIIHSAHIAILKKAALHGRLLVGVLSDDVVSTYKRFPLVNENERLSLLQNIKEVLDAFIVNELSYKNIILKYKPNFVVHGDDWKNSFQKPIREELIKLLDTYGAKLIEYPYSRSSKYDEIEKISKKEMMYVDKRRALLKNILQKKSFAIAMEAHNGLTGLIVENTVVLNNNIPKQFDCMWISSLCDSVQKAKPDIELVDLSLRMQNVNEIMEVTTKPIIFDGDTGGLIEHFVYNVRSLERIGVSMVIIEDKCGLKKNSLFGLEVSQTQEDIDIFSEKISAGKNAQKTKDFMICARIESLILEKGMLDALKRAKAYVAAGADAIMIHSRKKDPNEIFEFVEKFRANNKNTPIVVVPTSFNEVYESEFKKRGVNIVIYANQFTRSSFPAMKNTAVSILQNNRAKEIDESLMPIKEIINLIPEE